MSALYEPFDGDFEYGDGDELSRLAADLLGDHFTEAIEIAVSLFGSEMKTDPPKIRVEVNLEEGEGWAHDQFYPIPEGWTYEQIAKILADGYTVYFKPIKD